MTDKKIEEIKKEFEEELDYVLADALVNEYIGSKEAEEQEKEIFSWFVKRINTEVQKAVEEILSKGHGGGNWRRLLMQYLQTLKDKE